MKLAYIINARLPTELAHGHQTARMCAALASRGVEVVLLYPRRRQTTVIGARDIFDYYGIPRIFTARALWNIDTVYWLEKYVPRPCVIWIHAIQSVIWGSYAAYRAWRAGFRLYYTRDVIIAWWLTLWRFPVLYEEHALPTPRGTRLLVALGARPSLRMTIAVTSFIRNELLIRGFPSHKVIVLPDAVDLSLFTALPDPLHCRMRLTLPDKEFLIGYIGRFRVFGTEEKGILGLIQAVAILARAYKNIVLVLVGGPTDAATAYWNHARVCGLPLERLRIIGHVPPQDVPQWMRACNTVVIPWHFTPFSAYATSPLKLFEYMASGTPIIASDLPSLREIVNDKSAVFVRPGDPDDLARGITLLLENPELGRRLATQARKDVELYTWLHRAERIAATLR